MADDPRRLLPQNKKDLDSVRAIVALGYPAVAPVLPDLLEWLQDSNWPVWRPIAEFLASLPEQMAPLIWDVLRGDDHVWKYHCIAGLIQLMPPDVAEQFRAELTRLAERPSAVERAEGLDEAAQDALHTIWPN